MNKKTSEETDGGKPYFDMSCIFQDVGKAIAETLDKEIVLSMSTDKIKISRSTRIKWKIKDVYYRVGKCLLYLFFRDYYDCLTDYYEGDW
jgi:hypothetical protein